MKKMDLFLDLGKFDPPSASSQLKIKAYQHQHIMPQLLTPEAIESKKREKKLFSRPLYYLGLVTTEA